MNGFQEIVENRKILLKSYPNMQKDLTELRDNSIKNLTELIDKSQITLKGKGCHVYYSATEEEAHSILTKLLEGQEQVVRSYCNTLKEIDFDNLLEQKNIKVNKTNINEIIGEMVKKKDDNHPIFSTASQLSKQEIIAGAKNYLKLDEVSEFQELNKQMHRKIKESIVSSEFGITGVNSVIAENGTLILAEDEGNGRAVSNLPYKHIVVAGIDKLTNTVEEAMTTIQGASIYGLGRNNPTYFSLISGPSRTADIEFRMAYGMHGPKEVHVILLDNGRLKLINKGYGDILKCINCGSCYNSIQKLALEESWSDVPFTTKGIALGAIQGKIKKPLKVEMLEEFECPVNLRPEILINFFETYNT